MTQPSSLSQTARRLAWIMFGVGDMVVVIVIVAGVILAPHLGAYPVWTVVLSIIASVALIATTCLVVLRLSVGGSVVVLSAVSYLSKIVVLLGFLLSANAAGLHTQFLGVTLLVVIVITVVAEVSCLAKARIPIITPPEDYAEAESVSPLPK